MDGDTVYNPYKVIYRDFHTGGYPYTIMCYIHNLMYVFSDQCCVVIPDIGSMLRVKKLSLPTTANCVSWTNKPISFYLHVVDRSKVRSM